MSIKSLFSLGMARIRVSDLELDPMKHIDKERVVGLARSFKRSGCRNDDVSHAVPALVDPTHLNAVLARANLSPSALLDGINTPELQFSEAERPHILYGDHRLRAVETLCRSERWWLVSLYDLGITAKDRASVLQLNRDKSIALNGRDLVPFLAEDDQEVLDVWTSNMSPTHKSTFSQLKKDDSGKLSRKVQQLLSFRGLQYQYRVGNWERILSMRCREEVYAYLDAISKTWAYILEPEVQPDQLDESTVLALQMYCPTYSSDDCDTITKLFVTNQVFPSIWDGRERENIARRILSCKRILTFASFFGDFIYLRTCFDGMCQLLPSTWKENGSFQKAFLHEWEDTICDRETAGLQSGCNSGNFHGCYVDLWLFAMRNFPCLSDGKASQPLQYGISVDNHTEFRSLFPDKRAELACLASKHGFETDAIKKYKLDHPTHQFSPSPDKPGVSCNDSPLKWKERSNRPSRTNYIQCKEFLHRVYIDDASSFKQKKYVTAYAIARDIVHCCWRPDIDRWVRDPEGQQQPQYSNKKRSFGGNHDGPRQKMTRLWGDHTEVNKRARKPDSKNRKVTDNQKEYEDLMFVVEKQFASGEVATRFEFGDAHPGASATHRKEEEADSNENDQVTPIKEELQQQDGVEESIESDAEDKTHMSPQPLAVVVEENPGRVSKDSNYSDDDEQMMSQDNLFDDPWESEDESNSFEYKDIPMLGDMREAVIRGPTQSPIAGDVLETSTEECPQASYAQTEQQYANDATTATAPDNMEHKNRSSRQSSRELSGSVSRSGKSGSTSWARPHDNPTASEPTDKWNGSQAGEKRPKATTIISPPTIIDSVLSRRGALHQSVFPGGWAGVVKREATGAAPLDEQVSDNRQSMFPESGPDGGVKGDVMESLTIFRPNGKSKKETKEKVKKNGRVKGDVRKSSRIFRPRGIRKNETEEKPKKKGARRMLGRKFIDD